MREVWVRMCDNEVCGYVFVIFNFSVGCVVVKNDLLNYVMLIKIGFIKVVF